MSHDGHRFRYKLNCRHFLSLGIPLRHPATWVSRTRKEQKNANAERKYRDGLIKANKSSLIRRAFEQCVKSRTVCIAIDKCACARASVPTIAQWIAVRQRTSAGRNFQCPSSMVRMWRNLGLNLLGATHASCIEEQGQLRSQVVRYRRWIIYGFALDLIKSCECIIRVFHWIICEIHVLQLVAMALLMSSNSLLLSTTDSKVSSLGELPLNGWASQTHLCAEWEVALSTAHLAFAAKQTEHCMACDRWQQWNDEFTIYVFFHIFFFSLLLLVAADENCCLLFL